MQNYLFTPDPPRTHTGNLDSWVTRNLVGFHVGLFFALVFVAVALLALVQHCRGAMAVKRWLVAADIFFGCVRVRASL